MKNKLKPFLSGMLAMAVITTTATVLAESQLNIQVIFGRVKLVVDNSPVNEETLLYNGVTYVPLRAAAQMLDREVAWDESMGIAYLDPKGTNRTISQARSSTGEAVAAAAEIETSNPVFNLGDTIEHGGMEITFGQNIEWEAVDNMFSTNNGQAVVKVPVSVKNTSDEAKGLNRFLYNVVGSGGTQVSTSIYAYFKDAVESIGEIAPGVQKSGYYYFLYDGDGDYYMVFNDYTTVAEVKVPVKK